MSRLGALLKAVRRLHEATPALAAYSPWPTDLVQVPVAPISCEAATTLGVQAMRGTRATVPVIRALRAAAADLEWRQTYTEAEVGNRFLRSYGYVELFGPGGHFRSRQARGYIGYWGPDLTYDWHAHEAEELYFGLAGQAVFSAPGASNAMLRPGDHRIHASNQPHLMLTLRFPFLAYVLWRGAGLEGLPRMVAAR